MIVATDVQNIRQPGQKEKEGSAFKITLRSKVFNDYI